MALLTMMAKMLQESILPGRRRATVVILEEDEEVPRDVKEGHFVVIAVNSGRPKRFIVPLEVLGEPAFMALLEQAAEEFGFAHKGAPISVPCGCFELETILATK